MLLLSSLFNPSMTTLSVFGQPLPNIPYDIFNFGEEGGPANIAKAWGAALVLVAFVLLANFAARALQARSRKMMTSR
jgi:phosphate transport system permease protein